MNLFEDDEEEEVSEEDMILLERSISLTLRDLYKKRQDAKPVVFRDHISNHFFEWLLDSVDENQLKLMKEKIRYFRESQQDKLKKAKPFEYPIETKESGTIEEYIEYNQKLIQENEQLKKDLHEQWIQTTSAKESEDEILQENIKLKKKPEFLSDLLASKYKELLEWLYDFMLRRTEMNGTQMKCPSCKAGFILKQGNEPIDEDIERLEEIEEVLGK